LALQTTRSVELPKDFTLNIPSDEAIWLYKAGIGADLARFYGIGYSLYLSRIVVPVYEDGQLTAFTARLQHGKPKYIEKSIDPTATVFVAAQSTLLPSFRDWAAGTGPDCVILEDNLSAIRVGRCVRRAVSLMGTSASHSQLAKALRRTSGDDAAIRKVSIWLDPDKAGRSASRSLTSVLRLQGYAVQEITSVKDPKFYTNREIKEILS
jgi:DNA primase